MVEVLGLLLGGLADSDPRVRGAACFALGQLAEHTQPEVTTHYAEVLPALFRLLDDPSADVKVRLLLLLLLGERILGFLKP